MSPMDRDEKDQYRKMIDDVTRAATPAGQRQTHSVERKLTGAAKIMRNYRSGPMPRDPSGACLRQDNTPAGQSWRRHDPAWETRVFFRVSKDTDDGFRRLMDELGYRRMGKAVFFMHAVEALAFLKKKGRSRIGHKFNLNDQVGGDSGWDARRARPTCCFSLLLEPTRLGLHLGSYPDAAHSHPPALHPGDCAFSSRTE